MRYVDEVLQPGETIRRVTTFSWVIYVPGVAILILAAVLSTWYQPAGWGVALVGLFFVIRAWWRRMSTEIAVTDRRVIYKSGLVSRRTIEMQMDKIVSVDVTQSILGRLLNFGELTINGQGGNNELIPLIDRPLEFRNCVTAGKS